jgi:hypothetical protein
MNPLYSVNVNANNNTNANESYVSIALNAIAKLFGSCIGINNNRNTPDVGDAYFYLSDASDSLDLDITIDDTSISNVSETYNNNAIKNGIQNIKDIKKVPGEVRVRLDKEERCLIAIYVKYPRKRATPVPYKPSGNPKYIQDIIDNWFTVYSYDPHSDTEDFVGSIEPNRLLFERLSQKYGRLGSRKSPEWISKNVEWIKFKPHSITGVMTPSGCKRY